MTEFLAQEYRSTDDGVLGPGVLMTEFLAQGY